MSHLSVVRRAGGSKQIIGNTQLLPAIEKLLMIPGDYLLRRFALLFSAQRNWRSMLIAPRDHQYLITLKTVIASKDIGRQVSPSYLPQMKRTIGIRPGYADKNMLRHQSASRSNCYHSDSLMTLALAGKR